MLHHIPLHFNFQMSVWYLSLTIYERLLLHFKYFSFSSVTFHIIFSVDFGHLPPTFNIIIAGMVDDGVEQWNLCRALQKNS